ncbi:MAG: hypothetical protein OXJ52_10275, partial [Oligoflexia bacterium]|nr:hypothetical protein [Oligoflexia bacterium]
PLAYQFLKQNKWQALFFDQAIRLPLTSYEQIKKTIQSLYQLRNNKDYQKHLAEIQTYPSLENKKQDSVLMAYDFHLNNETAQLIEVNTNASAFLLVNTLYQFKNLDYKTALEDLKASFQKEWMIFNKKESPPSKIVLIDEEPLQQKMAIEFFMYKDFFKSMGWNMEILDSKQLKTDSQHYLYTPQDEKIEFIYNRATDFYFENHPALAKAYQKNTCLILPQPKDYCLLADKNRLADWRSEDWPELKDIKKNLLKTKILNSDNKQELWQSRKKYFFKICQGYGGKMAYKGASLSRPKFEELFQHNSLAQEYIAPSKIKDSNDQEWKLDLRAYVYKDQIQQLAGRVYQGQLTNFKAPGRGFATVEIKSD